MNIEYRQIGDYLLPELCVDEQATTPLTRYGRMRMAFLREQKPGLYTHLILSGKLYPHLMETQETAQDRMERIIMEMAKSVGIDESMKSQNQMAWVGAMNAIRQQAEEIVLNELIYC